MAIELAIPHPDDYPNDPLGYIEALARARREYNAACLRQIDSVPQIKTEKPKKPAMQTAHDFLSEHPYMRERYKKIGPLALLELD